MTHKHYKVVAMLGRSYGLRWFGTNEGTQTYAEVFRHRDAEDRFVIFFDPVNRDHLLVDMWETSMDAETLEIYMPEPQHFPMEDAAVMAARLQL